MRPGPLSAECTRVGPRGDDVIDRTAHQPINRQLRGGPDLKHRSSETGTNDLLPFPNEECYFHVGIPIEI